MLLVKKCKFFLYLVLVKTRLEIRFNVVDRKETFFEYKNKFFKLPKMVLFFFVLGQNETRNEV